MAARIAGWAAAALLLLLALSAALLIGWRREIAEALLLDRLEAAGLAPASAQVAEIDLGRLVIRDLAIGSDLSVRRLILDYSPTDLMGGRLQAATVEGAILDASYGERGLSFGRLDRLLGAERGAGHGLAMQRIGIRDAALRLTSPWGETTLAITGDLGPQGDGSAEIAADGPMARLRARVERQGDLLRIASEEGLSLRLPQAPAMLAERLPALAASFSGPLSLDLRGLDDGALALELRLADGAVHVSGGVGGALASGSTRISFLAEGQAEVLSDGIVRRLRAERLGFSVANLILPVGRLDATLLVADWQGAPPLGAGSASFGVALRDLDTPELAAHRLELKADGSLRLDGYRTEFTAAAPGLLTAEGLRLPGRLTLAGPLRLKLDPAQEPLLELVLQAGGGGVLRHRLTGAPGDVEGTLLVGEAQPFQARLGHLDLKGVLDLHGGYAIETLRLRGDARLPRLDAEARALDVIYSPASRPPLTVKAGALSHGSLPGLPLAVVAAVTPEAEAVAFSGTATASGGRLRIEAQGQHRPSGGKVRLAVSPIEFRAGGLQPRDLAPDLPDWLGEVEGRIAVSGDVAWDGGGHLRPDLELLVQEVTASLGALRLVRLNSVVAIDGFSPPSTPPGQVAAVGLIEAGLPMRDGVLTFRLGGGRLHIEKARLHLAGGEVSLGAAVVEPGTRRTLPLAVTGVELAELMDLTGIGGLQATGRLAGTIPVSLGDGRITVDGARLEATGPGLLRYRPERLPAALAGGGESVSLMLRALDNFHYRKLGLAIDGEVGAETTAVLHLAGANPDLYDGYPLEFNLNLSGKLDTIIDEALTGYQIPDRIRERMTEFGARLGTDERKQQ